MTENQLLGLIRQYGSKDEALKSMPAIDLQLNDKSAYPEQGQIESISGVIDRSTGTVSLRAVFPNKDVLSGKISHTDDPAAPASFFPAPAYWLQSHQTNNRV